MLYLVQIRCLKFLDLGCRFIGKFRESRAEATSFGEKKSYFPTPCITHHLRWYRIGDFRSIEEADAMMRQLEETGAFKEITIVRKISILENHYS